MTHPSSENSSSFRKRVTVLALTLGGLAALLAWYTTVRTGKETSWLDFVLLPLSLTCFLALFFLALGRLSHRNAEQIPIAALALYQLGSLTEFAFRGFMYQQGFSGTAMWFPLFYPLVFLLMPFRRAMLASSLYFGFAIAVLLFSLPLALNSGWVKQGAVNSIVQFYLTNIMYLLLLVLYARYRENFYQMQVLAGTDSLTGLPNRRQIEPLLEGEIRRALQARKGVKPQSSVGLAAEQRCAVLMLDLDHFKKVNDTFGHATGDQVLREVALRLNYNLRPGEMVARWGGEEFVVLSPSSGRAQAERLAERLRAAVQAEPLAGHVNVTVSIGIAVYRTGDTAARLLEQADVALYRAKDAGRNRVELVGETGEARVFIMP